MMMSKTKIIATVIVAMALGFASATALDKYGWFSSRVNIFDATRLEALQLKVGEIRDSAHLLKPLRFSGEISFAGERVPLEDPDVMERMDRELQVNTYWQSNTILSMKLANRYFPEIEKILQEEGVPADFKYLALIESGFRDAVSPSGAAGFWQFLSGTARQYGLEVRPDVDERYNIDKATRATCKYLRQAREKLGSWTAAAASYNIGIGGLQERMTAQGTNNYYELMLTSETSRYVFRMLAMKVIFANPEHAGYAVKSMDLYQPYSYNTVSVDTPVTDIAAFAAQFGLQYKHIKILNPWLRDAHLHNKERKTFFIRILDAK
jgi:membrane-bound lytic murein transglycosylase D